jgi:multiple antibiotic resistance protein
MSQAQELVTLTLSEVFTFFFIMLGPFKLLGPFAKLTMGSTEPERRSIALQGVGIATLTVLAAGFVGRAMLAKWNVSLGSLAIAGGLLFLLIALSLVLRPYTESPQAAVPPVKPASAGDAVRRLMPSIVTPHGIAAVILFMALMPQQTGAIVALLLVIMVLDLLAMIFARQILGVFAFPLEIVGSVLGVLQVALSIQVIVAGIRLIAVEKFGFHPPG